MSYSPPRFGEATAEGSGGDADELCRSPLAASERGRGQGRRDRQLPPTPPPNPLPETVRGNRTRQDHGRIAARPLPLTPSPKRGGGTGHGVELVRLAALVESPDHVCARYRLRAFEPHLAPPGTRSNCTRCPRDWWGRLTLAGTSATPTPSSSSVSSCRARRSRSCAAGPAASGSTSTTPSGCATRTPPRGSTAASDWPGSAPSSGRPTWSSAGNDYLAENADAGRGPRRRGSSRRAWTSHATRSPGTTANGRGPRLGRLVEHAPRAGGDHADARSDRPAGPGRAAEAGLRPVSSTRPPAGDRVRRGRRRPRPPRSRRRTSASAGCRTTRGAGASAG